MTAISSQVRTAIMAVHAEDWTSFLQKTKSRDICMSRLYAFWLYVIDLLSSGFEFRQHFVGEHQTPPDAKAHGFFEINRLGEKVVQVINVAPPEMNIGFVQRRLPLLIPFAGQEIFGS